LFGRGDAIGVNQLVYDQYDIEVFCKLELMDDQGGFVISELLYMALSKFLEEGVVYLGRKHHLLNVVEQDFSPDGLKLAESNFLMDRGELDLLFSNL
jgi:hypothetical protein